MRARRKGTDSPFVQIDRIQLEGSDVLYKPEVIEFDIQPDDTKIPVESITNKERIKMAAVFCSRLYSNTALLTYENGFIDGFNYAIGK